MTGVPGRLHSIPFPAGSVEPDEAAKTKLYDDSGDAIVWLGEMMRDGKTLTEKLGKLPFAEDYRGDVRVVLSAARRIEARCLKLLGEAEV